MVWVLLAHMVWGPINYVSGIRNGDSSYNRDTEYGGYVVAKCEQSLDTSINYRSKERTSKMSLIALEDALGYIGGEIDVAADMLGVYTGYSCGGPDSQSEGYQRSSQGRSLSPLTVVKSMCNTPLAEICLKVGAKDPLLIIQLHALPLRWRCMKQEKHSY